VKVPGATGARCAVFFAGFRAGRLAGFRLGAPFTSEALGSAFRTLVGFRRLPVDFVVSRRHRVSALVFPSRRFLGPVGLARLSGRLLPSALVSERSLFLRVGFAEAPGFVPVPGRRPVRAFRGCSGLAELALRGLAPPLRAPSGRPLVGRGFPLELGFRPAELFALGDVLPFPAPFFWVNEPPWYLTVVSSGGRAARRCPRGSRPGFGWPARWSPV